MSKILEGMAQAAWERRDVGSWSYVGDGAKRVLCDDQRAALLWLADNVSDEMVEALAYEFHKPDGSTPRKMLSAAIRAAAEDGK